MKNLLKRLFGGNDPMKKIIKDVAGQSKNVVNEAVRETADSLIELAELSESKGKYTEAADHYRLAAEACRDYGTGRTKKLAKKYDSIAKTMNQRARKGKLEKDTEEYVPDYQIAIFAGISFLLSIIISSLNITGQAIGELDKQVPIAGGLFFLIGIILLFFLSRRNSKKHL
jgi:hypothetical protein